MKFFAELIIMTYCDNFTVSVDLNQACYGYEIEELEILVQKNSRTRTYFIIYNLFNLFMQTNPYPNP